MGYIQQQLRRVEKIVGFVCEISARSRKQGPFNDVPELVPHVYSLDVVATGC